MVQALKHLSGNGKYVYVPSYQGVLFALYLHKKYKNVVVLTPNLAALKFFEFVEISAVHLEIPIFSCKKPFTIFKTKKLINQIVDSQLSCADLFIYHNAFDMAGFYLAALWKGKRKGVVFFSLLDWPRPKYQFVLSKLCREYRQIISCLVEWVLIRSVWNLKNITVRSTPLPVLGISDDFKRRYKIQKYIKAKPCEIRCVAASRNVFSQSISILLLGEAFQTPDAHKKFVEVLTYLMEYYPDILVKPHPSESDITIYKNVAIVPAFVPAELLIGSCKLVIGVGSTVLKEALAQGVPAVSLLKILHDERSDHFVFYHSFLTKNCDGNQLHMPASLAEIVSVIDNELEDGAI